MANNLGKILHFDEVNYEATIRLAKSLLPFISKLAEAYEFLGMGSMTNEIYQDLLSAGTSNLQDRYEKFTDKEIKQLKIKSRTIQDGMKLAIEDNLQEIETALNALKSEHRKLLASSPGTVLPLYLESFSINGDPILSDENVDAIKKHFTIAIETELQSQVYDHLETIRTLVSDTIELLRSKDFDVSGYPLFGSDKSDSAFFDIHHSGMVTIDANAIQNLNNKLAFINP